MKRLLFMLLIPIALIFSTIVWPVEVNGQGAPLVLDSFVDGSGNPLVMLGGLRGSDDFIPHAAVLSKQYRTIRLQRLNSSRARLKEPLPPDYSIATEMAGVLRTLDKLGVTGPVDLVGFSLGALIALELALDHPNRVRTLTLAEPPAFWVVSPEELRDTPDMRGMYDMVLTLGPKVEPTDDQLIRFRCLLGQCGLRPPEPPGPEWQEWVSRRSAMRGLSAVGRLSGDINRLGKFRKPVLIVTGTATASFHRRINDILAAHLPFAKRLELPGQHAAILTAQDEFLKSFRTFLEQHR